MSRSKALLGIAAALLVGAFAVSSSGQESPGGAKERAARKTAVYKEARDVAAALARVQEARWNSGVGELRSFIDARRQQTELDLILAGSDDRARKKILAEDLRWAEAIKASASTRQAMGAGTSAEVLEVKLLCLRIKARLLEEDR